MDIVTHAAMGIILAAPLADSHPVAAACFAMGSALPDLDVLARVFGKRAFLRWHQTYTHSLPLIALTGAFAWLAAPWFGVGDAWAAPALAAGMTLHVLLDVTNTYGITLWAPFSRARRSLEWVFFVDAFVLVVTVLALTLVLRALAAGASLIAVSLSYAVAMTAYWSIKAVLRHRASRLAPTTTVSLVPSALVPWRFLGCARVDDVVTMFEINACTGRLRHESRVTILDGRHDALLAAQPEVRSMRELTPAYHAVGEMPGDAGTRIICRDLRTRNFGGHFGTLTMDVTRDGRVQERHFHV